VRRRFSFFGLVPSVIVPQEHWTRFLHHDTSMLKSMYAGYTFQAIWFNLTLLLFKAAIVLAVVIPAPNTLRQLAACCFIEAAIAIVLTIGRPFSNLWIDCLSRIGSFHQLAQLGMMALHRVEVRSNPVSPGYANYMTLTTSLYLAAVALIIIFVLVIPVIRSMFSKQVKSVNKIRLSKQVTAHQGNKPEQRKSAAVF